MEEESWAESTGLVSKESQPSKRERTEPGETLPFSFIDISTS